MNWSHIHRLRYQVESRENTKKSKGSRCLKHNCRKSNHCSVSWMKRKEKKLSSLKCWIWNEQHHLPVHKINSTRNSIVSLIKRSTFPYGYLVSFSFFRAYIEVRFAVTNVKWKKMNSKNVESGTPFVFGAENFHRHKRWAKRIPKKNWCLIIRFVNGAKWNWNIYKCSFFGDSKIRI